MTMEVEPPKDFFFSSYYFAQININVYMLFNALLVKAHYEWSIEILELCLPFYGIMSLSLSNLISFV